MSSPLPPEGMILRKALRIRQAENAIARSVGRIFGQAFQGLTDLIRGQPFDAVTPGRQARRLASVIRQGDDILADAYRTIRSSVKAQLTGLSQYAGKSAVDEVLASLRTRGVSLSPLSVPTRAEFAAIVTHNPVYGAPLSDWWRQFEGNSRYRLHRELQLGMTRRESVDDLVRRISGTRWDRPEGVHRIARQEADTVVRTAVSEVQNAAHLLSYHRNSDVVEGVEWLSSLDDRACQTCGSRDGDRWALDDPDLLKPPEHPRCRCRLIPVVLGVPMRPRVTWEQWILDQPLTTQERVFGKRRAALVRDGTAVADLIREDGTFIPVRDL